MVSFDPPSYSDLFVELSMGTDLTSSFHTRYSVLKANDNLEATTTNLNSKTYILNAKKVPKFKSSSNGGSSKWSVKFLKYRVQLYRKLNLVGYIQLSGQLESYLNSEHKLAIPIIIGNIPNDISFILIMDTVSTYYLHDSAKDAVYKLEFEGHSCRVTDDASGKKLLEFYRRKGEINFGNLKFTSNVTFPYNNAIVLSLMFVSYCQRQFIYQVKSELDPTFYSLCLDVDIGYKTHTLYGNYYVNALGLEPLQAFKENSFGREGYVNDRSLVSLDKDLLRGYCLDLESRFIR